MLYNFIALYYTMSCTCNCKCCATNGKQDYPIEKESNVPFESRGSSPSTEAPEMLPNGGLYSGSCPAGRAWIPTKIVPTSTYFTSELLKQANPPPGALDQYVGTNRPGNNYTAMPNVHWYNRTSKQNQGPFNIKVTHCKKN